MQDEKLDENGTFGKSPALIAAGMGNLPEVLPNQGPLVSAKCAYYWTSHGDQNNAGSSADNRD